MFECLLRRLEDVGFLLLANVELMHDAIKQLVEDLPLAADVVDLFAQFVVDRQRFVELLRHLQKQSGTSSLSSSSSSCSSTSKVKVIKQVTGHFVWLIRSP